LKFLPSPIPSLLHPPPNENPRLDIFNRIRSASQPISLRQRFLPTETYFFPSPDLYGLSI